MIEFNVRLGDPETQPLMHRLEGGFGEALMRAATGDLQGRGAPVEARTSVCVVLAAAGYPGQVRTGDRIKGIESRECGAEVFHAGTHGARGPRNRGRPGAGRYGFGLPI